MNWLPFISVCVQVTLVAALGLLAAALLRSAAHRHSVLLAALLCILASPIFYATAAWLGLSITLPAVFPAARENAGAIPLPRPATTMGHQLLRERTELSQATREVPQDSATEESLEPAGSQVPVLTGEVGPLPWRADYLFGATWLLGTLFCFAGVLRSLWKTRVVLKGVRPMHQAMHAGVIAEAERQLGTGGVLRIGTTGKVAGPVVVGIVRPWILIPARYLETLSRGELLQVLIHEGAHALRRDPLLALLQRICGALFWWHPLVHLVNQQLTRAREEVCDNFVLTHIEPERYGATLLRLATLSPSMARVPLAIGMFDGRGKLEDRIRGLLDTSRKITTRVRFRTATAVLGAFALFSVCVAAARVGAQDPSDAAPDAPMIVPNEVEAATLVGTVVSPEGKPAAGIEVLAFQGGKQLDQKFTTDEKGEFRVPKAWREVEEWLTVVAREGRERLGWFDFMMHGHSDLGQKPEDGSFRLVLLPMNRMIRGRVVDDLGQPLAQIPVRINQLVHDVNLTSVHWRYQKLADEPLVLGAVTDNEGRFELKLPANTFAWLGASHPDWVEQQIRATKEVNQVGETKLVRAAKVAGRVIDSRTGKPLFGVSIGAYATKTEILESGGDEAKTDANGNYLIQGLRSGEYTIQLLEGADKTLTAPAYAKALLQPGQTFPADFSLSVGKRLSGRVLDIDTGAPIPSCKVTYTGPARPGADGFSTETNKLGEFEFFVPPGRSSLDATEGRRFGNDSTCTVDVPPDGNPEPVVLKVGEKTESVPGSFKIFLGPPKGLEFLMPYPKLHRLSLDMSEQQFLEIIRKQDLKTHKTAQGETFQFRIALGDGHTLIVMFRQDGSCSGIQRVRGEDAADENVSLADLVRDFNAENRKLQRGLDQPPLTEDEVVAAIQRSQWKPGERNRSEREFAVFKSVAQTRQLPKEAYFAVWTSEEPSTFVVHHLWSIQLFLPSLDGDGFDGFSIRHTKLQEEQIDPKSVAWGKPDADGLSLGMYLAPKKDKYQVGERVRLRLFVRNGGTKTVPVTFANTSHPTPAVTDQLGAKVAVRMGDHWSEKWISGFIGGLELGPGDTHAFRVPFELGIGGAGTNKLIGRVIDARPGQTLQLKVREANGNNRTRVDDEPEPESGIVTFAVAETDPR